MNARQLCNRQHNGRNEVIMDFRVPLDIELINKVKVIPTSISTNQTFYKIQTACSYLCHRVACQDELGPFDDGHVREAELVRGLD